MFFILFFTSLWLSHLKTQKQSLKSYVTLNYWKSFGLFKMPQNCLTVLLTIVTNLQLSVLKCNISREINLITLAWYEALCAQELRWPSHRAAVSQVSFFCFWTGIKEILCARSAGKSPVTSLVWSWFHPFIPLLYGWNMFFFFFSPRMRWTKLTANIVFWKKGWSTYVYIFWAYTWGEQALKTLLL